MMYLIFLIGIDIQQEAVCTLMSLLIQYFALASVFWMGAESILMAKKLIFVKVTESGQESIKFLATLSICCWGKLSHDDDVPITMK